ncbi:MAG TPA: hypothetical protein VIK74_07485, partial [Parasegetibacter sp.]
MQNWLVSQVTKRLSKDLNTEVDVNSVSFALFNRMRLNGTLVKDRNQDTLLYAGSLNVNITDWFFFKDYIELKYLGLTDAKIHLHRTDSVWNYQFLIDFFSVPGSDKKKDDRPIQLNIKNIQLENIAIFQQDEWIGEDRKISLASMDMDARQIDFPNKKVEINSITINQPVFSIFHYPGLRVRRNRAPRPPSAPVDGLQWNPDLWLVHVSELNITNGNFTHDKKTERAPFPYFDGNHIDFNNINARLRDLRWELDTIRTNLHLATKERSGFEVKSLKSDFSFFPGGMAFEQLDITTNRSHLTNYFSMQYEDFNRDMGDFIHSVILTGNFEDAKIDSDDIAYFAPELSNWKKQITINGQARGTIDNLKARNMLIEAGSNTVLNGDISLTGLPDIRSTYIDFKARDFRTTYKDAVTFVPQLKNITQPRLDAVKYLHFRGSFTGFITDFVTYGTITTNLGTIVSDLNMKLPENKVSTYSGGLSSQGFDLGSFTGSSEIGNITFSSKLKGAGFDAKTVNADLDAVIDKVEFRGYEYSNIRAVGKLSKKLFNGTFEINDPNAEGHLEGIVDLNGETSRFNFDAEVAVARLKNLNITRDEFVFSGKFQLNLEGNDIDNFLGEARVYDASLLRDQKRLSFDSLSLSSRIIQDHKTLILSSNEFDVVVVGKFAVREMPTAVQLFLSKYYPSYINKPLRQVENEDFSFVVKTKNVDEYIQLIDKSLSGFNSSSVSGRVNSKENIFSLDADIPHFTLNNIAFTGLILKANGDLNNLSVETSITNTFINDSLSFPETNITVNSRSDTSDISVNATSTQAFNAADIQARVITLKEGLKIRFNSSTFDLNGKNWTIDSGGELILGRNQLTFSQ